MGEPPGCARTIEEAVMQKRIACGLGLMLLVGLALAGWVEAGGGERGKKVGKFDMLLSGISITEERKKSYDLVFSDPYFLSGQGVGVRVGDTRIKSAADLRGKVVGVQINTTGQAAAEKVGGIKEIKKYEQLPEAYADLKAKRVDAVVADYPVLVANAKDDGKFVPVRGLQLGEPEKLGIPVRKEDADLITVVNKVIAD